MPFPSHVHDPQAVLDYPIDLSDFAAKGDPAVAVSVSAADGATIENVWPLNDDGVAVARISGSEMRVNKNYNVTFHFTLASGQEDDRSITLICKER